MRILHYTLGFQPHRTGGLIKYAEDLIEEELAHGHEVFAFYPGHVSLLSKKVAIKKVSGRSYPCYELLNSLPLALFGGIAEPAPFMEPCDPSTYRDFLKDLEPDMIHIHSLIGLHQEFFQVAKDLGIKMVLTSHDYYGLSPLPHFYFNGVDYSDDNTNLAWNIMSSNALSVKKLRFFQVPFYPTIRKVMKMLGKNPKSRKNLVIREVAETVDYAALRHYYKEMFDLIDGYLFNSHLAQSVYEANGVRPQNSQVISISNRSIQTHKRQLSKREKPVLAYIGPDEEYKGYFDFLDFVAHLDREDYQIETYGHFPNEDCPDYIEQKGYFTKETIDQVYAGIDILIVPSKWKETFGLITMEALSYGVDVFVSENVGSKDLVPSSHVFKDTADLLGKLSDKNRTPKPHLKTMTEHTEEVVAYYQTIMDESKV